MSMPGDERGAAMVIVLGLLVLLSVVVGALMTTGTTAARLRINTWNQDEARLAAEAGAQRIVYEARRVMTGNDPGDQPPYGGSRDDATLQTVLAGPLESIPSHDGLNAGVPLGHGQSYTVPAYGQPGGMQVTGVQQDSADGDLVDVTVTFASTGNYNQTSVTLNVTVVLQANRWLLPSDTVMLKSLRYQ